jgi:hypothetical protein
MASDSTCPVHLRVRAAVADPKVKQFKPVLALSSVETRRQGEVASLRCRAGDLVTLEVESDVPGFLSLLGFDVGEVVHVFPLKEMALRPGVARRFPFSLDAGHGADQFALVWTRSPLALKPEVWAERIRQRKPPAEQPDRATLLGESEAAGDEWTAVLLTVVRQA